MKKTGITIMLLALVIGTVCCGGGGGGSASSKNTSLVTITVGSSGQTASIQIQPETLFTRVASFLKNLKPSSALASIPSNVYKIVFTIAGPDMPTMTKEVLVAGQGQIRESFSVPNGKNRYFYVAAKSISDQLLYQGDATANLEGKPIHLFINMTALDTTPPTVISTVPASNATAVAITSAIVITFSETIDPSTFTSSTFSLMGNGLAVGGTISISGAVVTITPSVNLAYSTVYTATITTDVADMAGNHMAANYSWTFTTSPAPDTTPPTITGVSPGIDAKDIPITSVVTATFSEAMDSLSITTSTFILKNGSNQISGTVTYAGTTATFTPSANLSYDTVYIATVNTGVKDLAGNFMAADYSWAFTTASPPPPPVVVSTTPSQGAVGVSTSATISATFSKDMDSSTITTSTFTLKQGTTPISGTVAYTNKTATFTPSSPLALNTSYTATISAGVKDTTGKSMTADYSWSFTTAGLPLSVSPVSVTISGYTNPDPYTIDNQSFTISGGTSPYTVTSSNTALISNPVVSSNTFAIDPNSTCTNTTVYLTVTDSIGATVTATVNVQRPSPSFVASPGSICENDYTCGAGTETSSLSLYGVSPFSITSSNTSVIPNSGTISGYTYLVDALDNSIGGTSTNVPLTLTDSCGYSYNSSVTVINQDLFVNVGTGSDAIGNGTSANPFKTITKALSVTQGNEAINIVSGTYDTTAGEVFPLNLKIGTRLAGVTTPSKPLITDSGTVTLIQGAPSPSANNDISNLEIYGTGSSTGLLVWDWGGGSAGANFSIRNCIFRGNGDTVMNGVYLSGSNCYISDSVIYGLYYGLSVENNCTAERNTIYNNSRGGISAQGGNSLIRNNSIHDNNAGIRVWAGQPVINNNEIYCNTFSDLFIDSAITTAIDARNNAWDNDPVWVDSSGSSCGSGVDICYTSPPTPAPLYSGNTLKSGGCPVVP